MRRTSIRQHTTNGVNRRRVTVLSLGMGILFTAIIGRLFFVQVIAHDRYQALADDQHLRTADYVASRGEIYAHDQTYQNDEILYPLAVNKTFYEIYLNPTEITRPINTAEAMRDILGVDYETILARAKKENDIYEPVITRATEEQLEQIQATGLEGIYSKPHVWRYYPDGEVGSHMLGFYGLDGDRAVGKYGLEAYWEEELAGRSEEVIVARDPTGTIIPESDTYLNVAEDGSDLVLTIDKTVQYEACNRLAETVEQFAADNGTVIVMESATGKIRAMCTVPTFDPNNYGSAEDVSWFNNRAVFEAYEPGSVFKPLSMAIAIDQGEVTPSTVYEDVGEVEIADFTIRNYDKKAHGINTMTEVLEKSLNLGVIYATQNILNSVFLDYVRNFGFGQPTGIDISQESSGTLGNLEKLQDIYKATASFGQGLTATPIQIISAINVLANNGVLLKPFIVEEIRSSDGTTVTHSVEKVRQVVKPETAQTLTAMMVRVLDQGYDGRAAVDGYYLAGKTGTAQIAERGEYGDKTNHTFVGFGPANDPKFTILIKMHNVKNVGYAADSTTRMFHNLAEFLLRYYKLPPNR